MRVSALRYTATATYSSERDWICREDRDERRKQFKCAILMQRTQRVLASGVCGGEMSHQHLKQLRAVLRVRVLVQQVDEQICIILRVIGAVVVQVLCLDEFLCEWTRHNSWAIGLLE
jgi:hypothetical protein